MPALADPPTGTVTFLFTDIEGSTRLWEQFPNAMSPALGRHDGLLRRSIEDAGGLVFKTVGDAFCAAFPTANQALEAALAAQLALTGEVWELPTPLRVRMALHTGAAEERGGDYFGPPLNRVAHLVAAGHGGQTLLSDVTQELVRDALPPGTFLRDLGERRLKDLGRPEQVFQLQHPALPAAFPPLRSLDNPALPNNLPQQTTSFIGREKQVEEVKARLGKTRLLTLTGAGGSGKTRLSLQVAADLLDGEGDGVWLVELAALSDPALVPQAVADVLGVKEEAGKSLPQTLAAALKEKRLLLVLDNCEHLVAACASLAADLLRGCPEVYLLASSREPLNVSGEQTYRVPSLSSPDPKKPQTMEALSQYEAVRLFSERAQAVQPSFAVTNANAPAVAQVCFRLDGIPLALELAAARVRSLPVEQINLRLDQRFRLLTGGSRASLPRHQTLRALMDWSYDLLSPAEKALLRRLSVFAGGWTLEAAEQVCSGDGVEDFEVLDLLTSLVDKSLVIYEEREDGAARYGLLESVRQYGQERLAESGGTEEVERRHAGWALALVEEAEPRLRGPQQGKWLTRLEAEHDNLRTALGWCEQGTRQRDGVRLAGGLGWFWYVRGHLSEGRRRLNLALARMEAAEPGDTASREASAAQARALGAAGFLAYEQGDDGAAQALQEESLALMRQIGDQKGIAASLGNLGNVAYRQNDYEAARALYEEGLTIRRQIGDRQGIAWSLTSLANVAEGQGDYKAARALQKESLTLMRQIGDPGGIAWSLNGMGNLAYHQSDYEAARALYEESLALMRQIGNQGGIAWSLNDLGNVAEGQGNYAAAWALQKESLALMRQIGNQQGTAWSLTSLGAVASGQGRHARAVRLWSAAEVLRRQIGASLSPDEQRKHDREITKARRDLGEAAFSAAWTEGRAMTLKQAVEYALSAE